MSNRPDSLPVRPQPPPQGIQLTFQPPYVAWLKGLQGLFALMTLATLVIAAVFLQAGASLDEQSNEYEQATARQLRLTQRLTEEMAQAGLTLTTEQISAVRKEVAFANQLTGKRDFSWTEMLKNLEDATPPHVSIHSVRLNFQESTILLQGSVPTMRDLDTLVETLNETTTFSRVNLTQHNIRTRGDKSNRSASPASAPPSAPSQSDIIDFTLTVTYHQAL